MRFDIVPTNKSYSGIDRSLIPDNFLTPDTKPHYDNLLTIYFSYIDLMCNPCDSLDYDEKLFRIIQDFYRKFCDYNVSCELIAFNTVPIDFIWGVPFELLGIDVVHDMAESLIAYSQLTDNFIKKSLNKMGLFDNLIDANIAIDLLSVDDVSWKPCWVYKVMT